MIKELSIEEEIEMLESTISYLESAIEDIKENPYFNYKMECWESDIQEMKERLEELERLQDMEWQQELKHQEHEYWASVL